MPGSVLAPPPTARGVPRAIAIAIVGLVLLASLPTGLAAQAPDLAITIHEDGSTSLDDPDGLVVNASRGNGSSYAWTLNLTEEYHTAEIRVDGAFEVDRPRQVVPLIDGLHFVHLPDRNVSDVDQPGKVYNIDTDDGEGEAFTYNVGLPGPGTKQLTLSLDMQAPGFSIDAVRDVSHIGFDVETSTDEAAEALLEVTPVDGGDPISFPTPSPARVQRFPVQGLNPNTTYTVTVTFTDWSGNQATSDPFNVTTAPEPNPPRPNVTILSPAPDTTIAAGEPIVVEASWESPSPVKRPGVRLFFDKQEIDHDRLTFSDDTVTFRPEGPFQPREYSVSIEVTNQAGGADVARWSFTVGGPPDAVGVPLGALGVVGALVSGALVAARLGRG